MISEILNKLNCIGNFADGISNWQFPGLSCPYSMDTLKSIARIDESLSSQFLNEHKQFLKNYESLTLEEKQSLKDWIHKNFLDVAWADKKHRHIRVEYAWETFIKGLDSENKKFLDIGPGHGFHGVLIYKEKYKCKSKLYACDIMPCYNQLIQFCGVETQYYDASRMKLTDIYRDEKFDIVLCAEVLEHVSDNAEVNIISGLSNTVNKDGYVMITFPEVAMGSPYDFDKDPMGHCRQPSVKVVSDRLNDANFDIIKTDKFWSGKQYQLVVVAKRR